jgi:hypothetical protein
VRIVTPAVTVLCVGNVMPSEAADEYLVTLRVGVTLLWPNEGRFETPGLQGAPSNCRNRESL